MDQAQFKQLLQSALDGTQVKEATAKLKKEYYPNPQSLSLLLQILVSDGPPQLRQLAATQARTLVRRHWSKTPDGQKPQIRNALLQTTLHESNAIVRHASSRVIAVIASLDFADGEWTDLPKSMMDAATRPDAKEREVSTYIILTLLDEISQEQLPFGPLFELFQKTVQDPESADVRVNTVLALAKLAHAINCDDDAASLEKFQQALPHMMSVLKEAMAQKNDEHTSQCFDSFQELLDDDSRILGRHFKELIGVMAMIAAEDSLEKEARVFALNFLMNALIKRKTKIQNLKLSSNILETLWKIVLHVDKGDPRDESSLAFSAISLLNIMAVSLPPSQVVGPVVELFKRSSQSEDSREKQVAASMLGTCVEGAPEFMDQNILTILPLVLKLMVDPEIKVRKAAVEACNELAECLPDSVAKDHQTVMQAFAKNLGAAVNNLKGSESQLYTDLATSCCQGIEALARGIATRDLEQYLPGLVPHLSNLFSHPEDKIKQNAIGAVGSIAGQAKKAFIPYFAETMSALQGNLQLKEEEDALNLRAVTIDTMGSFALAVGPEAFKPYVQPLMQSSEEGLQLESPMLKESCYMFWATLASVYKADFASFLPGVTKTLLEVLDEFDPSLDVEAGDEDDDLVGKEIVIGGRKVKIVEGGTADADDVDVEETEVDEDDDDWDDIANLAALEEGQEMALDSLAQIFMKVGPAYLEYFPETIEKVTHLIEHPVDNVRKAAMSTLGAAYEALWLVQPEEQKNWQPGLPLKSSPASELTKLRDVLMTAMLAQYKSEEDSDLIAGTNQTLANALKSCGPHLIAGPDVVAKVIPTLFMILCKQHPCQHEDDDDEEDDEEDEDEEESEDAFAVIDSALDAVAGLAAALGPQFAEKPWETFKKPIGGFATSDNPAHRSAAVGTLAECVRGCGADITPHTPAILQLLMARAADEEDPMVRSNAAYGLGLLAQHSGDERAVEHAYPTILQRAMPVLAGAGGPDSDAREVDNWAGCLARLALRKPGSVPLAQVLQAIVSVLPLKEDYEENKPVWELLVAMYREGEAQSVLQPLTEKVTEAAKSALEDDEQLKEETRVEVLQLVKALGG